MTREEKISVVNELSGKLAGSDFFYITDASTLNVVTVNKLRAVCFERGVEMKVVKNSLVKKALASLDSPEKYEGLYESLKGPTAIMFTEVSNAPAKVIKEFRKDFDKPIIKAAYIDSDIIIGDENLDMLASLKSKEELIGDIITLLQSPIKNVIGGLNSGGSKLAGLVKALQERA